MRTSKGLTLVEVVVSTLILGVLMTAVMPSLSRLFQATGASGQNLQVTTQAQEVVEFIKGQWKSYPIKLVDVPDPSDSTKVIQDDGNTSRRTASRSRYDSTCGTLPALSGVTVRVTVTALDRNASAGTVIVNNATALNACTATANAAPIKRVRVVATTTSGSQSDLTVDVVRP